MTAAKEATDQALAQTQSEVDELQAKNEELEATMEADRERTNGEIADLRSDLDQTKADFDATKEELAASQAKLDAVQADIDGIFKAYEANGLTVSQNDGRLYVMTDDNPQYNSGSAGLSRAEKDALKAVAETLKSNPDLNLVVEGHTDDKKMVQGATYRDNWDLSVARSSNVVRELIKQGVNPEQLTVNGRGEYAPVDSNDSNEGRAKNRRVELIAQPDYSSVSGNN